MDALLTSFIAVALAEWGDKTQLLVLALAARHGRAGSILAGVAIGALASSLLAATGGIVINGMITLRAISLLLAVALLFAGVGALVVPKEAGPVPLGRAGPFLAAAIGVFLAEFGDRSQFVTVALSAQFDSFFMAALGATAGVVLASVPAALLGDRLALLVPVKKARTAIAALFLLTGAVVGVNALRLI